MDSHIKNAGAGVDIGMHVDKNEQAHIFSVTEDEQRQANDKGNEYNLNTGLITLTGTTASAVAYFKNNESADYVISALAFFMGIRSGTVTDFGILTMITNPTEGTIFDATPDPGDMKSNSNFGSGNTLSDESLFYKGTDGDTFTNGTDHGIIGVSEGRGSAPLNIDLPKGSSVGFKIDINTSGGCVFYLAIIGYLKDLDNK